MLRSQGDDRPSVVEFCTVKIDRQELRKEYSPAVWQVLRHCNQILYIHGGRHGYLVESYAQLCKALISTADLKTADIALEDFREALDWAAPWHLAKGG